MMMKQWIGEVVERVEEEREEKGESIRGRWSGSRGQDKRGEGAHLPPSPIAPSIPNRLGY